MPVGAGAGAASGRAWGWEWRPMTTGSALAHRPALEADLDGGQVEGVEDDLDARAHQGGVDLEGVASASETVAVLVTVRASDHKNASWSAAGVGSAGGPPAEQPLDRGLAGL